MRIALRLSLMACALLVPACGSSSSGGGAGAPPLGAAPLGNALLSASGYDARLASDGAGGAFIVGQTKVASVVRSWIWRLSPNGHILWGPTPLTTSAASLGELYPDVASDGAGGAWVSWAEIRNGSGFDVRAQRFDASGARLWTSEGVETGPFSGSQTHSRILSDGLGGAIVAWQDNRALPGYGVFAQRLGPSGDRLWAAQGLSTGVRQNWAVHDPPTWSWSADAAGEAHFLWVDQVDFYQLSQQRVDAGGALPWGAAGRAVAGVDSGHSDLSLIRLSSGAYAATWTDYRDYASSGTATYLQLFDSLGDVDGAAIRVSGSGAASKGVSTADAAGGVLVAFMRGAEWDVVAQHVDAAGQLLWGPEGTLVGQGPDQQIPREIRALPGGGALVLWRDFQSTTDYDLYAGRVDGGGSPVWPISGVPIAIQAYDADTPASVLLGDGHALIVWTDRRAGRDAPAIYYELLSPDATATPPLTPRVEGPWHARNVSVAFSPSSGMVPLLEDDGQDGTLVLWHPTDFGYEDSRVQRLDPQCARIWGPNGALIRGTSNREIRNTVFAHDGSGGAFVVWSERDEGSSNEDVFGQHLDASGNRLWGTHGIPLVAGAGTYQLSAAAVPDGAGGIFVAYYAPTVLRLQRFDAAGAPLWASALDLALNPGLGVKARADGGGGVMVFWNDQRESTLDIYAQRVDADGNALWAAGGSGVETPTDEYMRDIAPDGAGGVLLAYSDVNSDAGVRGVDSAGAWYWTSSTFPDQPSGYQKYPLIQSDGSGGAYVLCQDLRDGMPHAVLRRLDATSSVLWEAVVFPMTFSDPGLLLADGAGGAYVAWTQDLDVFAQRFDSSGNRLWSPSEGLRVSSASGTRMYVRGFASAAGLRLVWNDARRGYSAPFAQLIPPNGQP